MVDELLSDSEREEALREWWRDNWRWIIGGVVVGVGLLIGWHYFRLYREQRAEDAGQQYAEVQSAAASGDAAKAQTALDTLARDFDSSVYTQQARLLVARMQFEAGKYSEAEALLRTVADKSRDEELGAIAQLRLARLLIQQGKHDDAVKLLEPLTAGGFGAQAREIRGDALFAKGDSEGARAEYAAALANQDGQVDRTLVELKLQDVGGTTPPSAQTPGQP
jgi:predicted negative regulator of RcsB-dependent stress response